MSDRRQAAGAALATFLLAWVTLSIHFLAQSDIADGDSYYHLGVARQFAENGIIDALPWARFSTMRDGFGDKELGFHLLLAPFVALGDPLTAGRIALGFVNALIAALLTFLGFLAVGRWGALAPLFVYVGSPAFFDRAIRLRPELLAIAILLAAIWLASQRRYWLLAAAALLFTWSYTAFHVLAGICVLFALADLVLDRRLNLKLIAFPLAGTAAGVLLHPHFPHNVRVWWFQNVLFFRFKDQLDVGTEIGAPTVITVVMRSLPLFLTLAVLVATSEKQEERTEHERPARYYAIACAVFAVLYALFARMATYFAPLLTLAVLFGMAARGRRARATAVVGISMIAAFAIAALDDTGAFRPPVRDRNDRDLRAMGRSVPAGAKVVAHWKCGWCLLFAPQGRYLNFLDPVFMAVPHPREYRIQRRLFSGDAPDVAAAVRALDSDYLLFHPRQSPRLFERVEDDPRFAVIDTRAGILARVVPPPRDSALLDWRVLPGDAPYPRAADPRVREVETYVDLNRVADDRPCVSVRARTEGAAGVLEFAPWGPAALHIDGRLAAMTGGELRAIPGRGIMVPIESGPHLLTVTACRPDPNAPRGFFLAAHRRPARR